MLRKRLADRGAVGEAWRVIVSSVSLCCSLDHMSFWGIFFPLPLISAKVATMVEKKLAESHASLERRFELLAKQLLEHGQHTPGEVRDIQRPHGVATVGWLV